MKTLRILRKIMVRYPHIIREILLTKSQLDLIAIIRRFPDFQVTSRQLSNNTDMAVYSASQRLKTLVDSGYLTRRENQSTSGGIEFIYTLIDQE